MTPSVHKYAVFVAVCGFVLIVAGGLVTSTGSGLAVPDWPLSFGRFFPPMVGGVFFEHGHRMIAGGVGLLTFVLAIWIWRSKLGRGINILAGWTVAAVLAQALLGGLTVLMHLPSLVSVAHATLGQTFFTLLVCLAVLTAPVERVRVPPAESARLDKLRRMGIMTTIFVYLQLMIGATLRHTGQRWAFHLHLLVAFLVTLHILLWGRRILTRYVDAAALERPAQTLLGLLGIQLVLGFYSWKAGWVSITTAHVAVGALILAVSAVLTLQSYRGLVVV